MIFFLEYLSTYCGLLSKYEHLVRTPPHAMSTWFMNDFLFLEIRINLDLEDEKC